MAQRNTSPKCCEGCSKWNEYGRKCWVFWEGKKECTMNSSGWKSEQVY